MKITATIEGISPLLMHRRPHERETPTASGRSPTSANASQATPREQARKTAYRDHISGELYLPRRNLFAAIVDAGKFHKLGNRRLTTRRSSFIPVGIAVMEQEVWLGTTHFEVDSRPVRASPSGGSVMRHRARVDRWKGTFTLHVNDTLFPPELARALLEDAGQLVGVGDFRPSTRGPFGRFRVSGWEIAGA